MKFQRPFEPGQPYQWNLVLMVGNIPAAELSEALATDGRPMGILADRLIVHYFDNLQLPDHGCESYDILERPIFGGARAYEVKTASRGRAANLLPSYQKGAGRHFDQTKHDARRRGLFGYIILDVADLPRVRVIGLSMTVVTAHRWDRLIPRRALDEIWKQTPVPFHS